jgi:hypothetical protein
MRAAFPSDAVRWRDATNASPSLKNATRELRNCSQKIAKSVDKENQHMRACLRCSNSGAHAAGARKNPPRFDEPGQRGSTWGDA